MSLPDAPNTLREKYYSVMAGQNDADILPDIETAPSTENRYLDYLARNGGGGEVTKEYVDTAIANAVADKVDKVEGKGLSTNDYTNADKALVQDSPISSTSTNSPLTDSADGMVQGVTIYGRSEVVEGEIKSVGDDGLTVTTANSDNTLTTSATFTTALPLRGVSDTVRDKLICTAESKQVDTVCGAVDLGDLTWEYLDYEQYRYRVFRAPVSGMAIKTSSAEAISDLLCENYQLSSSYSYVGMENKSILRDYVNNKSIIVIKDADYTDTTTFKAAVTGVKLIYPLAEPVTTPLSPAEISAFRGLRTYDSTTNITISDEPEFEIDYLKNTVNGQAVANIQTDLQGQIDGITYSLDEVKTDDVWINGKPIYRRTVQFTQWNEQFDATSMNIDNFFVDYSHSFFVAHSSTVSYTAPFVVNGGAQFDMWYDINTKKINMRANNVLSGNTLDAAYYTILYTKTTDTGNS